MDKSTADAEDQNIIKAKAKRQLKLGEALKKGYTTVYDQCSQEVRDKLELSNDWDKTQKKQLLEELTRKIEHIYIGFDNHKQDVFNLMQVAKTLILYTQGEKESVEEEYGRNFKSIWDMWKRSEAP